MRLEAEIHINSSSNDQVDEKKKKLETATAYLFNNPPIVHNYFLKLKYKLWAQFEPQVTDLFAHYKHHIVLTYFFLILTK
jgi:hypothetical protein